MDLKALLVVLAAIVAFADRKVDFESTSHDGEPSVSTKSSGTGHAAATEAVVEPWPGAGLNPERLTGSDPLPAAEDSPSVLAAKCSDDDKTNFLKFGGGNAIGTLPKIMADCGLESWSWDGFDVDVMRKCVERETGVTADCASCYADFGRTSFEHCLVKCLNWCSTECLECTASAGGEQLETCLGFEPPEATPCDR